VRRLPTVSPPHLGRPVMNCVCCKKQRIAPTWRTPTGKKSTESPSRCPHRIEYCYIKTILYIYRTRAAAGIGSACGLGASPAPDLRVSARAAPPTRKYRRAARLGCNGAQWSTSCSTAVTAGFVRGHRAPVTTNNRRIHQDTHRRCTRMCKRSNLPPACSPPTHPHTPHTPPTHPPPPPACPVLSTSQGGFCAHPGFWLLGFCKKVCLLPAARCMGATGRSARNPLSFRLPMHSH
jgi:hypothetical protein